MELFSKQDPQLRETLNEHINNRWGQLHALEKEWGERALRYLLLTNSGGAIATLGFLGASPAAIHMIGAKISLILFVAGVFLVGISTAKQFHHMSELFNSYKTDVEKYHSDEITWNQLNTQDDERAKEDFFDYLVPYLSFGCFIGGSISGGISLFI